MRKTQSTRRKSFRANRIALPFEKAVEGLLAVKPRKAVKPKKKPVKK